MSVVPEYGSKGPAQKPARGVRFDHWVPRIAGSNLAKSNEPLCRPPAAAGSADRRVDRFHLCLCTAVCAPV